MHALKEGGIDIHNLYCVIRDAIKFHHQQANASS
jgi:hypothetical protein